MVSTESVKLLEELHRLKADGIITDEEFAKSKEGILAGLPSRSDPIRRASEGPPRDDEVSAWMFRPLKKYADFTGRAPRKEFWLFQLVFLIPLAIMGSLIEPDPYFATVGPTRSETTMVGVIGVYILALLVPQIAVTARRFHDQNLSGWLTLLYLIPYVGWIIVFVFMVLPGTEGHNRHDPEVESG